MQSFQGMAGRTLSLSVNAVGKMAGKRGFSDAFRSELTLFPTTDHHSRIKIAMQFLDLFP